MDSKSTTQEVLVITLKDFPVQFKITKSSFSGYYNCVLEDGEENMIDLFTWFREHHTYSNLGVFEISRNFALEDFRAC